jgi:hypothetical protein
MLFGNAVLFVLINCAYYTFSFVVGVIILQCDRRWCSLAASYGYGHSKRII